jgi:prevent-host-death family protein
MKEMSIQDLKAKLSAAVAEAESGSRILITRHSETVAELGPPAQAHVRLGSRVGRGGLAPALRRGTKGRYLTVLLEDRGGR